MPKDTGGVSVRQRLGAGVDAQVTNNVERKRYEPRIDGELAQSSLAEKT